jgi:LacI family transcriptional regulator
MVSVERATRIFTRIDELEQQMDQESELNDLPEKSWRQCGMLLALRA